MGGLKLESTSFSGPTQPATENQFHDEIYPHKEVILWNQCPGSLKILKTPPWFSVLTTLVPIPFYSMFDGCEYKQYCVVMTGLIITVVGASHA
jgi:hypothetical protein